MKSSLSTLANDITITRLILAWAGLAFMADDRWPIAFVLLFIAIMLDIVDGVVARKLDQVSRQGIFLDVMADKIVIISTFLMLGFKIQPLFFYLGLLMLAREYVMDTIRSIAASNQIVIPADRLSKIKGVLFMTSMLLMIGNHAFLANMAINTILLQFSVLMAVAGMIIAYVSLVRCFILHRTALE